MMADSIIVSEPVRISIERMLEAEIIDEEWQGIGVANEYDNRDDFMNEYGLG
jgi:hypothetical protein